MPLFRQHLDVTVPILPVMILGETGKRGRPVVLNKTSCAPSVRQILLPETLPRNYSRFFFSLFCFVRFTGILSLFFNSVFVCNNRKM